MAAKTANQADKEQNAEQQTKGAAQAKGAAQGKGAAQEQEKDASAEKGSDKPKKQKGGVAKTVAATIVALLIVLGILGGVWGTLIHNNFQGMGDAMRPTLADIPVVNMVLPALPDPEDPKFLTAIQLRDKYNELRTVRDDQKKTIDSLTLELDELKKYKSEEEARQQEMDKQKKEVEALKKQIDADKAALKDENTKFQEAVARSDKGAFQQYFEKVEKETAAKIYTEIMNDQKATDDAKKYAKLFEGMEPKSAAEVMEAMGGKQMDLIVATLRNMKSATVSEIISEMNVDFAAVVSKALADEYMPPDKNKATASGTAVSP